MNLKKWLIDTEQKYGGLFKIKQESFSPKDPRPKKIQKNYGGRGGDRMSENQHNYADAYSRYLANMLDKPITLIELGILRGTGIAIWSDLFPEGRIIGLDINLTYFKNNLQNLYNLGAFKNNNIEYYEFDQYEDNTKFLEGLLGNNKVDVFIDDAAHVDTAMNYTFENVLPFLNKGFVYFIEDTNGKFDKNKSTENTLRKKYPQFKIEAAGRLLIISGEHI